jgi:multimeric flavodoxin WrbA
MIDLGGSVAVFACSHRSGGNSSAAAELAARGVREAGANARIIELREYNVLACQSCRACAAAKNSACVLRARDQAEALFAALMTAPAVVFASPIYFYGVPSLFKTWIDRSQRFWEARRKEEPWVMALRPRKAMVCFVAGQRGGQKLFEGARLTLKYFLVNFGLELGEPLGLRGMEASGDLLADAKVVQSVLDMGREAGKAARHA